MSQSQADPLSRQLNSLVLPPDILSSLTPRDQTLVFEDPLPLFKPLLELTLTEGGQPTCITCGNLVFESAVEQRAHFRLDWHRFNVKRRLMNASQVPVTEPEFEEMVADLTDSLSGTESTASISSSADEGDTVSTLLSKHAVPTSDTEAMTPKPINVTPQHWFTTSLSPFSLGIYRAIFTGNEAPLEALKKMQVKRGQQRTWVMIMVGGGHFAGAVVDVEKSVGGDGKREKGVAIVVSKGFHRYTTRRKQGGAQSANDNSKGKARSAGAQIRRHNEAALKQEVRDLLSQWKEHIRSAELLFLHAPSANKNVVFGYEGAVLEKGTWLDDPRLRSFPFSTKRPTLSELKRCFVELTTPKISALVESALHAYEQSFFDHSPAPAPKEAVGRKAAPPPQPVESLPLELDEAVEKLIQLTQRGKTDALLAHLARHSTFTSYVTGATLLPFSKEDDTTRHPTLLHVAAAHDQAEMVGFLLERGADPTITSEGQERTAYEVAKEKDVRNMFRRIMAETPEKWEWAKAKVPSGLTKEMEEERERKEKERKAKERERKKKQAKEKKEKEKVEKKEEKKVEKAGGGSVVDTERMMREVNLAGLSPEMRAKIEREKRAKAAEMRFAKAANGASSGMSAVKCEMCGKSVEGVPFERLNYKYCSTGCVAKHRAAVG